MKIVLLLYDLPSCYRCLLYPSQLTHALPSFIRLSTWRVNCMLDLHVPGVFCLIHHVHAAGRPGGIVAVCLCPHAAPDQPPTAAQYLHVVLTLNGDLHVPGVFCLIHHVHAAGRPGGIVAVCLCPHAEPDQPPTAAQYLHVVLTLNGDLHVPGVYCLIHRVHAAGRPGGIVAVCLCPHAEPDQPPTATRYLHVVLTLNGDLHVPGVYCLIHHVHAAGRPSGIVAVCLCPHAEPDQPSTAARYLRQDTQQFFRSGPAVILPHTARAVSDHDAMVDLAGNAN